MPMPKIIVRRAGLGGTIAAYEIRDAVKGKAEVMVVNGHETTGLRRTTRDRDAPAGNSANFDVFVK